MHSGPPTLSFRVPSISTIVLGDGPEGDYAGNWSTGIVYTTGCSMTKCIVGNKLVMHLNGIGYQ